MAVIGHAEIVVRAITNNFEKELKSSLSNITKNISIGAGKRLGDGFFDGFNRSGANTMFGKLSDGFKSLVPDAAAVREQVHRLTEAGYVLQTGLGSLVGAISSVVVSIGPLIGSLMAAAPAAMALVNIFTALKVAMTLAKVSFGGIFNSVKQATQQNKTYGKSLKQIREEWQQLLFDAEAASYSEEDAALNLEKAFENLRRTADLPPNSAARREAELEYKKADLAFRRAKDKTKDLNETVQDGFDAFKKAQQTANGGGANPFANLNQAQTEFAKRLVELDPKLKALKQKMSEAFLDPLYNSVDIFEKKLLPILDKRLPSLAGKVGSNIDKVFQRISTPDNLNKIDRILVEMEPTFDLLGDLVGNIADIFLSILDSTDGIAQGGLKWIVDLTKGWSDTMTKMNSDGSLKKFFDDAGKEAARWGTIIGNVFGGFVNMMKLTTGPGSAGDDMLTWFTEASAGFKNMFADNPDAGKQFFKDAMGNARAVFSSIGALIKEILAIADNPNIKTTFDTLKEGAPYFGKMMEAGVDAGPSFAKLVVSITRIMAAFGDSGAPKMFFETLNWMAEKLANLLENKLVQDFLKVTGTVLAFGLAISKLKDIAIFAGKYIYGALTFPFELVGKAGAALGKVQTFFMQMNLGAKDLIGKGGFLNQLFGKLGLGISRLGGFFTSFPGIAIITLLVTLFIDLYTHSETFRKVVENTMSSIGEAFGRLWESLKGLFDQLFGQEGFGGIMEAIRPATEWIMGVLFPMFGMVINTIVDAISVAIDFITSLVRTIMNFLQPMVSGIMDLFQGKLGRGMAKIFGGIGIMILGIVEAIVNTVISAINVVLSFVSNALRAIGDGPIGAFLKMVSGGKINLSNVRLSLPTVNWTGEAKKNLEAATAKMATGGVVYPSTGGTMVTVAEAGKAERIEPLHPNGLSDRDIAIMRQMGGGSGINITVNAAPGMDEKELAAAVSRRLAFEMRKGTI